MIQKCIAYWYSECLLLSLHVQPYQSLKWSVFSPSLLRCVSFVKIDMCSWHNSVFNCVFAELSVIREQKTLENRRRSTCIPLQYCYFSALVVMTWWNTNVNIIAVLVFFPCCMECQHGLAMRKVSVRLTTRDLWQTGRKICPDFYTIRKIV